MSELAKHERDEPELRFPEFEGEWEGKTLGDFFTFKNGINADKSMYGYGQKFINVLDIINEHPILHNSIIGSVSVSETEFQKNEVIYGDILFQRSSETREEVGQSNVYVDREQSATFGGFVIRGRPIEKFNSSYFNLLLKTQAARKDMTAKSGGSTRYNVGQEALSEVKVTVASSTAEQEKIASFLSAVDEKIAQLEKKKKLLEDYKKGCMQQLFSQALRFKDEEGNDFPDWEEKRFNEVFERILTKNVINNENVLTISAQMGLVNQIDYFNHSVSAKDISGYYLLEKGDFAYNKSYSKGYPMGAIKRLNLYKLGVVSTLYICFRAKHKKTATFYEQYFNGGNLNHEIYKIAQEGARNHGLLNMSVLEFFKDIKIMYPHPDEQQKITNFLSALDDKITHATEQLEQTKTFKKGLLQKMFV